MFDLPEKITIWKPIGNDGFGKITWSAPIVVDGRFALKQEKFTDSNGDQQISKAVVYSESEDLIARARVFLGESGSLSPIADADDIRAIVATPSATTMKKAWM